MKMLPTLLGAWLCLAVTSHAVLWTGEIYFTTDYVPKGEAPDYGSRWWGYPVLGETELFAPYWIDAPAESPDGSYGNGYQFMMGDFPITLWQDPIPNDRWYLWGCDGGFQIPDFRLEMRIKDGLVTEFIYSTGYSYFFYSEWENYVWEDHKWGFMTITKPRRVSPVPDGGATLPLAALAFVGLMGLCRWSR